MAFGSTPAAVDGPGLTFAVNVRFIIEFLKAMDTEQMSLSLTNNTSAIMVQPVGREDYTYVVMPMHVGSEK